MRPRSTVRGGQKVRARPEDRKPIRWGVIAHSDLPAWVKPIGVNDGWSKFSVFYGYTDHQEMIEEYVFASMGMGVEIVAHAWHLSSGQRPILLPGRCIPPLVMVAAGIIAAAIEVTLRERQGEAAS